MDAFAALNGSKKKGRSAHRCNEIELQGERVVTLIVACDGWSMLYLQTILQVIPTATIKNDNIKNKKWTFLISAIGKGRK